MLRFCRQIYCLLQIALYIIFGIIWLNRGHHKFSKIIWSTSKRLFNLFVGLLDRLNCQKIVMKNMWINCEIIYWTVCIGVGMALPVIWSISAPTNIHWANFRSKCSISRSKYSKFSLTEIESKIHRVYSIHRGYLCSECIRQAIAFSLTINEICCSLMHLLWSLLFELDSIWRYSKCWLEFLF